MKLRDYLAKVNPKTIVAIGPAYGTAFLYIGEAGDTDLIELTYKRMIEHKQENIKGYKGRIQASKDPNSWECDRLRKLIYNLEKDIQSSVPYMDREVVKTRRKEIDASLAIFIEGDETGKFWLKSEFDKFAKNTSHIIGEGIAQS